MPPIKVAIHWGNRLFVGTNFRHRLAISLQTNLHQAKNTQRRIGQILVQTQFDFAPSLDLLHLVDHKMSKREEASQVDHLA